MITCCELALYIALGAFTLILSLLSMFFNYNLKLEARTFKLEKKNGHEQHQIDKLNGKVRDLEKKLSERS
jgi:cell division protein FtsL